MFEKHAQEYLQKLKGSNTLSHRVRQEIYSHLKGEEPGLRSIARSLAMSERSIQLRLKEENITYRQLLDEVRKETAISHLKEPNLSITDIAYLLGFSEPAVFSRTFRKWTGSTPHAFRKAMQADAPNALT
jgi:AraC-like DNA-binding protein